MSKILFIEDELKSQDIIRMFGAVLTNEDQKALKQTKNRTSKIVAALKENQHITVINDFIKAIEIIDGDQLQDYHMIILDRNLYGDGMAYEIDQLPEQFNRDLFHEREGDYLISLLNQKRYDLDNSLLILTGNSDPIREKPEFKYMLSDTFKEHNIILKGSDSNHEIEKRLDRRIEIKYSGYGSILKKHLESITTIDQILGSQMTTLLLNLFVDQDSNDPHKLKGMLVSMRQILEAIATHIVKITDNGQKKRPIWFRGDWSLKKSNHDSVNMQSVINFMGNPLPEETQSNHIREDFCYRFKERFNQDLNVNAWVLHCFQSSWYLMSNMVHYDDTATINEASIQRYLNAQNGILKLQTMTTGMIYQLESIVLWLGEL